MARNVTIKGMEKLEAALQARALRLQAAAVAAVASEVKAVEADAQREVPVDTGELRDGIASSADGTYGEVVSRTRHTPFVEFGTSSMAAQPFMAPAAEASRTRFVGKTSGLVRRAVK